MEKYLIKSKALRATFFVISLIIWAGIALSGFDAVHWLLYIPAVFLGFASITGICPGLIFNKMLFKEK